MKQTGSKSQTTTAPPDGGYGWVVVTCSFMLQVISVGLSFSVGVYYVEFLETFRQRKGDTAWIGSINTGLLFGAGPVASILTNLYGPRVIIILGGILSSAGMLASAFATSVYYLYFSYGIIAGFGFCFTYIPCVVIVGFYFDKRRKVALGIAVSGCGFGSLLFPPVLRWLIVMFGWRGSLIVTSGICLNSCVLGALSRPLKLQRNDISRVLPKSIWGKVGEIFDISLLKDIKFMILLLNNIFWNIGSLILFVIAADFAIKNGVDKEKSALLISIMGLSSTIGRIAVGIVCSHPRCSSFYIFVSSTAISGVAICLFPVSRTYAAFVTFSATYGLFFGVQLGVLAVVMTDLFGIHRLTSAYGYIMFGNGAGALLGPPIAGIIHDATHSYEVSLYLGGSITLLSAMIMLCVPLIQRMEKQADEKPFTLPFDVEKKKLVIFETVSTV